ncbi:MAG TPA: MerR family transcriptional regulator [Betaproteobacteria bacterium]|nr:MerR family transcriptional regulator [Betaproteobacteria bacterium]
MAQTDDSVVPVEAGFTLTLEQLAWSCGTEPDWIYRLVQEEILLPTGEARVALRFDAADLARAQRAWRLQHELGANFEALALMLDLLDEIEHLRTQLRCAR